MDLSARLRSLQRKPSKKKGDSGGLNIDPIEATKLRIKNKLATDVEYRTMVLSSVKTLAALEPADMKYACESMEEQRFLKGQDIIRQGEKGDSLYLLQHGSVVITRKVNPRDTKEEPTVLAKLPKNVHFGEIALLTDEPRSATVTALEDCVCAVMKKVRFDEIVSASNAKHEKQRLSVGRSVLSIIPTFSKFSPAYKDIVVSVMQPLHFPPGSYICKEGALASSFFIMLEGQVKCTVRDQLGNPGEEKEMGKMGPGSYFGEASLLDPSNTRNCNIISVGDVSCMQLQRNDFATIFRGLKKDEEDRAKAMMKKKAAPLLVGSKGGKAGKRKITAFTKDAKASDEPHPELMKTIVSRMARFITESTWVSQYSKMYRSMLLDRSKVEDCGPLAWELMLPIVGAKPTRTEAISAITRMCLEITAKPPAERTYPEQAFVCGALRQTNSLQTDICLGWHPFQYTELCKACKIVEYKPLDLIQDVGVHTTTMYLILRGSVRTWRGTSRTDLRHDQDLLPGEYFGEAAMIGNNVSLLSARAISSVHVAVFEEKDFKNAASSGVNKTLSKEEKEAFIRSLPLFKRIDDHVASEIANSLEQVTVPKRALLTRRKELHHNWCFIHSGYAEVAVLHTRQPQPTADHIPVIVKEGEYTSVAKVYPGESYGESGFVKSSNINGTTAALIQKDGLDYEHHDIVAAMPMEVLMLKPKNFGLIDRFIKNKLFSQLRNRVQWRAERVGGLKKERWQVRMVRKSMTSVNMTRSDNSTTFSGQQQQQQQQQGATIISRRSMSPGSRPATAGAPGSSSGSYVLPGNQQGLVMRSGTLPQVGTTSTTTSSSGRGPISTNGSGYDFQGNNGVDLDDVPRLLDGEFDPFMVIEAQKTQREMNQQTYNMCQVRLPKHSRGRGRTVESEKEQGFVARSLLSSNPGNTRPNTAGAGLATAVERYRSHLNSRGRQRTRESSATDNYTETSQYTAFQSAGAGAGGGGGGDGNEFGGLAAAAAGGGGGGGGGYEFESMMMGTLDLGSVVSRPASQGYLKGSSRIPNSLSYIDSQECHSPPRSISPSRGASRPNTTEGGMR